MPFLLAIFLPPAFIATFLAGMAYAGQPPRLLSAMGQVVMAFAIGLVGVIIGIVPVT